VRHRSEKELKKLNDDTHLLRAWKAFHREELEEALAGPHRSLLELLMAQLKNLDGSSGSALVHLIRSQNWSGVDARAKFVALHEINTAVCKLRERDGKPPIDDGLWGERANVFQTIRSIFEATSA